MLLSEETYEFTAENMLLKPWFKENKTGDDGIWNLKFYTLWDRGAWKGLDFIIGTIPPWRSEIWKDSSRLRQQFAQLKG